MKKGYNIISYKNIFLFGFIFFCVLGAWSILEKDAFLDIAFKIIRFTFLLLFYMASTKHINFLFIISVGLLSISSVFFSTNPISVEAIVLLGVSRMPLIKILLGDMKKEYWKPFTIVTILFSVFLLLIMYLLYQHTLFYYVVIFSSLLLIVLLALSFALLLGKRNKKQHIEMFIGVFLFVVTDAVFGSQKLVETNYIYLLVADLIYNVAIFFVTLSVIKKRYLTYKF